MFSGPGATPRSRWVIMCLERKKVGREGFDRAAALEREYLIGKRE